MFYFFIVNSTTLFTITKKACQKSENNAKNPVFEGMFSWYIDRENIIQNPKREEKNLELVQERKILNDG